ncbi:MAG: hypothetical protein PVS2B2_06860 [Candidatus Acidiferrum sp.]
MGATSVGYWRRRRGQNEETILDFSSGEDILSNSHAFQERPDEKAESWVAFDFTGCVCWNVFGAEARGEDVCAESGADV